MEALEGCGRSRANSVTESYMTWLRMREALEKEDEDAERERRRIFAEGVQNQQRALAMCLDLVSSVVTNTTIPNAVGGGGRSCWKMDRRQNNFDELFGTRTDEETFKRHMRMTEESFENLLRLVRDMLQPSRYSRGDYMSPRRTLALTILRLAHGLTYLQLGQLFAIGISSAHKCYARGVEAICSLRERFIRMPSTERDIASCIASFSGRGFPNACLAVDGCHVKVELTDQFDGLQDFICYKGFYSLNNMAYVDGKGMFRAVLCGWAGSSADGGVVREMHFTRMLQGGLLTSMHRLYKTVAFLDPAGHLVTLQLPPMVLADSAFGLEAWQMNPYKGDNGSVTNRQRRFNWFHSSARVVVEHAFGRLKGRFRLLLRTHKTSWKLGAHAIMAAMVLHNFLGVENDEFLDEWAEGVEELEATEEANEDTMGEAASAPLEAAMVYKEGLTNLFVQQGRPVRRNRNR